MVHIELRTGPPHAGDVRDVLRGCGVAWSAFVVGANARGDEAATVTRGSGAAERCASRSEIDGGGGDDAATTSGAPTRPVPLPGASSDSPDLPVPLPVLVDLVEGELEIGALQYDSDDE
eukprot:3386345-Prymnesium_polylepis.1